VDRAAEEKNVKAVITGPEVGKKSNPITIRHSKSEKEKWRRLKGGQ